MQEIRLESTDDELKWFKRLERVLNDIPRSVWLFAADSGIHMMRKKEGKHAILKTEGMDQDYCLEYVICDSDGGDW